MRFEPIRETISSEFRSLYALDLLMFKVCATLYRTAQASVML